MRLLYWWNTSWFTGFCLPMTSMGMMHKLGQTKPTIWYIIDAKVSNEHLSVSPVSAGGNLFPFFGKQWLSEWDFGFVTPGTSGIITFDCCISKWNKIRLKWFFFLEKLHKYGYPIDSLNFHFKNDQSLLQPVRYAHLIKRQNLRKKTG